MNQQPGVTILIPVYNREKYIRAAIDSILAQTFTDFELLIIDDASTDSSLSIINSYKDERIRLVRNPTNLGIPKTRNRGLELAKGNYLAFLDSDDVAVSHRIARQIAFLNSNPDVAAVGAWISWIDEQGNRQKKIKRKPVKPTDIAAQRLFRSGLENSASMGRLDLLRKYGHREEYELGSDYDMWARMAADHKLANLPEVLVYRRQHTGRTTEGQTQRIKKFRLQIYAEQIQKLNLKFNDSDLENHYLLRRMQKMGFRPNRTYLEWAEQWLLKLQDANRSRHIYPEPAFSDVLAAFWLKVCLYALKSQGLFAAIYFYRSSLRDDVLLALRRQFYAFACRSSRLPAS